MSEEDRIHIPTNLAEIVADVRDSPDPEERFELWGKGWHLLVEKSEWKDS
jgi:hypothetical protein